MRFPHPATRTWTDRVGPVKLRSRLDNVEPGAHRCAARRVPSQFKIPLAEPAPKTFASHWPGLSMPVDLHIGESCAIGRMVEVGLEPNFDQVVSAVPGLCGSRVFIACCWAACSIGGDSKVSLGRPTFLPIAAGRSRSDRSQCRATKPPHCHSREDRDDAADRGGRQTRH